MTIGGLPDCLPLRVDLVQPDFVAPRGDGEDVGGRREGDRRDRVGRQVRDLDVFGLYGHGWAGAEEGHVGCGATRVSSDGPRTSEEQGRLKGRDV